MHLHNIENCKISLKTVKKKKLVYIKNKKCLPFKTTLRYLETHLET